MASPYDTDLNRNPANFQPLTPLSFLARAAAVYPDHPAVIHGARSFSYRDLYARTRRLASALARRGIKRGDTVAVVLANTPAMGSKTFLGFSNQSMSAAASAQNPGGSRCQRA